VYFLFDDLFWLNSHFLMVCCWIFNLFSTSFDLHYCQWVCCLECGGIKVGLSWREIFFGWLPRSSNTGLRGESEKAKGNCLRSTVRFLFDVSAERFNAVACSEALGRWHVTIKALINLFIQRIEWLKRRVNQTSSHRKMCRSKLELRGRLMEKSTKWQKHWLNGIKRSHRIEI